jgi:hypothetical protein
LPTIHLEGVDNQNTQGVQKLNSQKSNDQMKKSANELNRAFSKENVQKAKKHMKICSPSLAIKEMQIKTTIRSHLTPVRIATIKNTNDNKCWQGRREKGALITAGGNVS